MLFLYPADAGNPVYHMNSFRSGLISPHPVKYLQFFLCIFLRAHTYSNGEQQTHCKSNHVTADTRVCRQAASVHKREIFPHNKCEYSCYYSGIHAFSGRMPVRQCTEKRSRKCRRTQSPVFGDHMLSVEFNKLCHQENAASGQHNNTYIYKKLCDSTGS